LIIGVTEKAKSDELFSQKEAIKTKISEVKQIKDLEEDRAINNDHDIRALQDQHKGIDKKQEANYELLTSWNKIWLALLMHDEFLREAQRLS